MKIDAITPVFVQFIPKELKDGILYISEEYSIAAHNCASGCGEKVITPLSPAEWRVIKNGGLVSLHPSIGNWNYKCQSHYWIRNNKIVWGKKFSQEEIRSVQRRDAADREKQIERINKSKSDIRNTDTDTFNVSSSDNLYNHLKSLIGKLFT